MERPALQRLLSDIKAGEGQIIVVYKVDRLTRSLADFAKIVDMLDAHGASFVSVTQQFNTTTSMGRLTLNMLLSFAQFEREIAGERIRDKIAASKAKGMWMGAGKGKRLIIANGAGVEVNQGLVELIKEAFAIRNQLLSGSDDSIEATQRSPKADEPPIERIIRQKKRPRSNESHATQIAAAKPPMQAEAPEGITKQERMLTLLSQPAGASIEEMMHATGWQQHSVRGFLAGTVKRKL